MLPTILPCVEKRDPPQKNNTSGLPFLVLFCTPNTLRVPPQKNNNTHTHTLVSQQSWSAEIFSKGHQAANLREHTPSSPDRMDSPELPVTGVDPVALARATPSGGAARRCLAGRSDARSSKGSREKDAKRFFHALVPLAGGKRKSEMIQKETKQFPKHLDVSIHVGAAQN